MIIFSGTNHIKISLYVICVFFLPKPINWLLFVLGACVGSLLPDIDSKTSFVGRLTPLHHILTHAKETHTLLCWVLLFIPWYYYPNYSDLWYGIMFGYIVHLIGDDIDGVPLKYLFFPLRRDGSIFGFKNRKKKRKNK